MVPMIVDTSPYDAMLGRTCSTLSRLATKTFSAGNFFRKVW